jgi:hypothetical protein
MCLQFLMPRTIWIYALIDPRTHELRYIGQTGRSLPARLTRHIRTAKDGTRAHMGAWIRGMLADGVSPELVVVEEHPNEQAADEAEQFWIEYFRSIGCRLVNRAIGGAAIRGWRHTSEQREKWRRERRGGQRAVVWPQAVARDSRQGGGDDACQIRCWRDPASAAWEKAH